ncbi:MAG TPA: DUF4838 domain-containing protein [Planctomycetota bacterium]|nr:DUF4838 domain-containing protein [Planctomycetota bacterium]
MSRWSLCAALCGLLALQGCSGLLRRKQHVVLMAVNGQPSATIVIAKEPTKVAQLAAFELQHHVKLITGATLPIVGDDAKVEPDTDRILVGESAATIALRLKAEDLRSQEYLIRFLPRALVLMGRDKDERGTVKYDESDPFRFQTWPDLFDEQGTLYAVYDFLERYCDVRWYSPTEVGTVAPRSSSLAVFGRDVRRAPAFAYRDIGWPMGMSEVYNMVSSLWPPKSPQLEEIDKLGYADLQKRFPDRWQYIHAKRGMNRLFLHRMRLGGERYQANHSFYGYYPRFWEKAADPKQAELFAGKKPEFFAQGYDGQPPQMCYTNEGFIAQVVEDARDYFDGKGKKANAVAFGDFFALVPMDNGSWCKCDACQAELRRAAKSDFFSNGYASGYVFGFANKVAKAIKESHPDKFLATLAYAQYGYYPRGVRLEPNIAVQLCLQIRNTYDPAIQDNDLKFFKSWVAREKRRPIYLWLYYCFPQEVATNGQWYCFPGFFAHGIERWLKLYHRYGVRGAFFNGWGQDVENYVTCKLLDDPTQSVDAVLDDYFQGYYGAAAEPMEQLYLAIEETYSNPANYPAGFSGHQTKQAAWEHLGTEERMARFAELMAAAKQAAATDAEKQRVALFEKEVWDYMVEGRAKYFARAKAPVGKASVPRLPDAGGDAAKIDWAKAAVLTGFTRREGGAADRRLEARLAHDGTRLCVQLEEKIDPKTLVTDGVVWASDDWEVFVSKQPSRPYRQLGVGPTGAFEALAHGEDGNTWDSGVALKSDTSAPDRWTIRLTFPLDKLVPGGAKPGDVLRLNVIRVISAKGGRQVYVWSPESNVHEPDRFGEVTLAP